MKIKSLSDFSDNCIHTYSDSQSVKVCYHPVYQLTSGGSLNFFHDQISLYCLKNASLICPSEIIMFDDGFIAQRYRYPSYNFEFITDPCVAYPSNNPQKIVIANKKPQHYLSKAFSLLNYSINHWSHFLAEVLPKLLAFDQSSIDQSVPILIPEIMDPHIRELIDLANTKNRPLIFLKSSDSVFVEDLFWISNCSYICNHSTTWHPACIVIPPWTRKILYEFLTGVLGDQVHTDPHYKKIYLGRNNERSLVNSQEIHSYFSNKGFITIESPHLLSLLEKLTIFRSASFVVGPASSALMNCIFNSNSVNLLGFYNYTRSMDSFLTQIWASENPTSTFNILIGNSPEFSNLQSNYSLELSTLQLFVQDSPIWSKVLS